MVLALSTTSSKLVNLALSSLLSSSLPFLLLCTLSTSSHCSNGIRERLHIWEVITTTSFLKTKFCLSLSAAGGETRDRNAHGNCSINCSSLPCTLSSMLPILPDSFCLPSTSTGRCLACLCLGLTPAVSTTVITIPYSLRTPLVVL